MLIYYLVTALHVIVCIILILVVLLQSGKGADLAGAFGGGATQTAFGSRGSTSFLSKLTTVAAILFMGTCLTLYMMGGRTESKSVLDTTQGTTAPASKAPAEKPEVPTPTPEQIKKMQEEIESKQKQAPTGAMGTAQGASAPGGTQASQGAPAKEKSSDGTKKP